MCIVVKVAQERARALLRRGGAHVTSRAPGFPLSPLLLAQLTHRSADMANVADTKLYDILGVSPSATENELKKVQIAPFGL